MGASISLVAGAAVSLLVVSFIFAYDGLAGSGVDSIRAHAEVVIKNPASDPATSGRSGAARAAAVVIRAPVTRPAQQRRSKARERSAADTTDVQARMPAATRTLTPPAAPPRTSEADQQPPAPGDGVRELGDGVSATVEGTGAAASGAATPLGPPVTQAVQEVINLLNGLIEGATNGLGGALDGKSR